MAGAGRDELHQTSPDDRSDAALMAQLAEGEMAALGELYDRYGGTAYALAYRLLADRAAAEDVVQDTFLSLWRNAARFDAARGTVRFWLLTTVRRRCIDLLRMRRRGEGTGDPVDLADAAERLAAEDDVWRTVERTLTAGEVRRALAALPAEQQQAIQLAFFGGLTHAQIAAQMHLPLGTVKGRLRLALDHLRAILSADGGRGPLGEVE
jgi:RNA polymerase sigma-70 factor (ECF subfamily)